MAFRHRLDSPVQWAAAGSCGKLVAQGILEARDMVPQLLAAAVRAGYDGDLLGLQSRITWEINDNADVWRRERDRTEFLIRRALQPMLEAWADANEIFREADAVNEQRGAPLLWREVTAIVEGQLAFAIERRVRTSRRRHVR